jgi:hypothetical protein
MDFDGLVRVMMDYDLSLAAAEAGVSGRQTQVPSKH